jgi:hypothetical protein
VWKQPKRVQAVDGVVVDALAQNNRHQGRRARVTEEAGKQHSVRRRYSESLLSHSPWDLLADDYTAMSHAWRGGWIHRFGAHPPRCKRRWADRGLLWSEAAGGSSGEHGGASSCSFRVAQNRNCLGVDPLL